MPDIELRFNHDMLVLSAPVDVTLARQGVDAALDRQYLNLMEPDVMTSALRLETVAGAQCIVTTTEDITRARLAHVHMESDAHRLAQAALYIAAELKPQHVLAEIGPCGLPLDASSKASLNENRAQYADAARAFEGGDLDAFFLNGFSSIDDLKCALMGVAQVSAKPVFASVVIAATGEAPDVRAMRPSGAEETGVLKAGLPFGDYELVGSAIAPPSPSSGGACITPDQWPAAIDAMVDLGAAVVGFETADNLTAALNYARTARDRCDLPLLAQVRIAGAGPDDKALKLVPLSERTDYAVDTMENVAVKLYGAGVQFLRATGLATPAFTGGLAATVQGLDVHLG